MEATMRGVQELLDQVNRRADAFASRLGEPASGVTEGAADGRFTLPGLIALLAVGARDRPREPLVAEALSPAVIERVLDEVGRLRGVPVRAAEVREVVQLLTTGELLVDVATGLRAVLVLVPRLPLALTRDALTLPELPRAVAEAIRADLKDDAPRSPRDVIVDLRDGRLEGRRRILTNTLRVLLGEATPGVLVETIRALVGPENQTLRLAVLVYARTQGIDLDEKDLDALFRALDPANPDLGVLLDRGLERVTAAYGDASRAVAVLRRIVARHSSAVSA
jgi:hypothetical protein